MSVTIYHNPNCGTSRNTLAMIRNAGIEPEIIEYLKTPPNRETLKDLIARAGLTVRAALPSSYQRLLALAIRTTDSMTGTSISTPTTVARAAPDEKPKMLIAAATASSKKLLAPINAEGAATQCASPVIRLSR